MLEGLREVEAELLRQGILLVVCKADPPALTLRLAEDAALLIVDRGYLRHLREWRLQVAREAHCRVIQVEGDAVVPIGTASNRAETAARTLRPKITAKLAAFTQDAPGRKKPICGPHEGLRSDIILCDDPTRVVASVGLDMSVKPVRRLTGGMAAADAHLDAFIRRALTGYATNRNEPGDWHSSLLSPYLHFGQISPVDIVRRVSASDAPKVNRDAFIDELVVRRELGLNFVTYEPDYDRYKGLPDWARRSLAYHEGDQRPYCYTRSELENGETNDRYWNAAVREMIYTGYMHNYMRMYWAKKILEWSASPESAFRLTLALMNKYFLDGRDPLSYSNVAWCFGQHDRPWPERPVFGKVRSMTKSGLERKFDMDKYIREVDRLVVGESSS